MAQHRAVAPLSSSSFDGRRRSGRAQNAAGVGRWSAVRIFKALLFAALTIGLLSLARNFYFTKQPMHSIIKQATKAASSSHTAAQAGIVIVGGGLAGLAAAVEALQRTQGSGVTVALLEKEARTGGNSAKASSGINGAGTQTQRKLGINDTVAALETDTLRSARGEGSSVLVERLAQDSAGAVEWLQTQFALDLDVVAQLGGHSVARTHRRPDTPDGRPQPVGWGIVSVLARHLADEPRFRLVAGARVTTLELDGARISGVRYEQDGVTRQLDACAVVLATGGFGGGGEWLKRYAPQLEKLPATNGAFATGDGLQLATAVGAALVGMERVQVHPTGFVRASEPAAHTKFLAAEALRGAGALLLDARGRRFVDELATRDVVTSAINSACGSPDTRATHTGAEDPGLPAAFLLLSQAAADAFGHGALGFYEKMGLVHSAAGLDALAAALRMPRAALEHSLRAHDEVRNANSVDAFGKRVFPQPALNADAAALYFWAVVTPSIHYTMGGLRFDEHAHVLRATDGAPIPGLLAAGEVTGGLHGANRLAGNSLLECVVFGREAGRQAAMLALV